MRLSCAVVWLVSGGATDVRTELWLATLATFTSGNRTETQTQTARRSRNIFTLMEKFVLTCSSPGIWGVRSSENWVTVQRSKLQAWEICWIYKCAVIVMHVGLWSSLSPNRFTVLAAGLMHWNTPEVVFTLSCCGVGVRTLTMYNSLHWQYCWPLLEPAWSSFPLKNIYVTAVYKKKINLQMLELFFFCPGFTAITAFQCAWSLSQRPNPVVTTSHH